MDQSLELWQPVVGYEGHYSVSTLGRVKSEARTCANSTGGRRSVRERILKPQRLKIGYFALKLAKEGVCKTHYIHRLVAEAFLGPCPQGMMVLHGTGGSNDNSLANLSYGTPHENAVRDKIRDGTFLFGERCSWARLTADDVRAIRASAERGCDLSIRYGVSPSTICAIRKLKAWAHLG